METHRIQTGDTFASLAVAYYGHEKYTQFLMDANPQIGDPRRLRIGASIKIPPAPPAETPSASKGQRRLAAVAGGDAAGRRTYRVEPGDSFYSIARKVLADASRWEEVFALNNNLVKGDPKKLQVGQVLVLPNP
ncbi:MAG: LysM peptidoglycan-binding domain-containing protein [Planctomycetota bacterium]